MSRYTLLNADSIQAKAGTGGGAINYTVSSGDEITSGTEVFKILAQGQLTTSVASLYSPGGATKTGIIQQVAFSNTTGLAVTGCAVYVNGTAAGNQETGTFTIPANGSAFLNKEGLRVLDGTGALVTTMTLVATGDASGTASNGALPLTLATVNSNVGQFTAVTVNGKGLTTAATNMAATGDATGTASSAALPLVLATVNSNVGSFGTSSQVGAFTVNAKGLTTAASNTAIRDASASQSGFQSAIQFNTVSNLWYDVTQYGVTTGNTGAANVAAMNTLIQTTAGAGDTFYFPDTGANYPMTGTITVTKNYQTFAGSGMRASVIFSSNTTVDLFFLTDGVRNITFKDLGFWSTGTASAGAMINCGTASGSGNAQVNVYRCGAEGFGGNWYDLILYNGTLAGLLCNVEDCNFNSFTHYGIAAISNTSVPSTVSAIIIDNTTLNGNINGSTGATAGIFIQQCGAFQISNTDIIQCTNNILAAPATSVNQVIASIYAINSYFDYSYGSCVKLGGAVGPIVRCKFVSCSFTIGATGNYTAFEISNTATNPAGDIDVINCNIQNTFNNSGTTNGMLLTAVANIKIVGNNINGFTNNIQASAAASSATKLNILGNSFGPGTVTATASTNDILLNAGTYGYVQITTNIFAPTSPYQTTSTNHINDASVVANPGLKNVFNNIGMSNSGNVPALPTAAQSFPASATTLVTGTSISLPTQGLQIGNKYRFDMTQIKTTAAGATAWTAAVKWGTANSTADAAIASFTSGVNTGAIDTCQLSIIVEILTLGAAATCRATCMYIHNLAAAAGLSVLPVAGTAAAFDSRLASPFLHLDITHGTLIVATGTGIGYQIQ